MLPPPRSASKRFYHDLCTGPSLFYGETFLPDSLHISSFRYNFFLQTPLFCRLINIFASSGLSFSHLWDQSSMQSIILSIQAWLKWWYTNAWWITFFPSPMFCKALFSLSQKQNHTWFLNVSSIWPELFTELWLFEFFFSLCLYREHCAS